MSKKNLERTKEKPAPKPKLADTERHKRFVDMAHEVEASDDPNVFDEAFKRIASGRRTPQR